MSLSVRTGGVRRLLLIALMLELAMGTAMASLIWTQWKENDRIVTQKAHTETVGVAGRLAQVLERVDLLIGLMKERVETAEPATPALRNGFSAPLLNELDRIARRLPDTSRLLVADARHRPRELHIWQQMEAIPESLGALHADQGIPFAITGSTETHRPTLIVSRRLDRPDGSFDGILAVSLDIDMISGLRDNPELPLTFLQLLDEDGTVLARWTRATLKPAVLPSLPASVGSWTEGGWNKIVVAEPVPGFSLRVAGTFPRTPFLQQWLNLLLWTIIAFAAVTVMAGFGIASVVRETRRRIIAEIELSAANSELQILIEATRKLASVDALTGIANRRVFDERLEAEMLRARRSRQPLSMMMLDLDHFKWVNDHYGHIFGDQVLAVSAKVLRSVLRETDVPARYGGEEFAVILPDTDLDGACALAERLCRAFDHPHHQRADGDGKDSPLTVTTSIGVTQYRSGEDAAQFITRADTALYRSKADGRNRVSSDRTLAAQ